MNWPAVGFSIGDVSARLVGGGLRIDANVRFRERKRANNRKNNMFILYMCQYCFSNFMFPSYLMFQFISHKNIFST